MVGHPHAEVILYATPSGSLARQCARYFRLVEEQLGSTTAQRYPPHISLTGFFRRPHSLVPEISRRVDHADRVAPVDQVRVRDLVVDQDWLGLTIESDWLIKCAATFAGADRPVAHHDEIRCKQWLHLSLAYGELASGVSIGDYAQLASDVVDPTAPAVWTVGLWERTVAGEWIAYGPDDPV